MAREKLFDARDRCDERMRQFRKWRFADNDQQTNAVPHDGVAFVGLVADALIVSQRDPAAPTNLSEPDLVRRIGSKMIGMPLDGQAACFKNLTESFAEVAVREVDAAHAARS